MMKDMRPAERYPLPLHRLFASTLLGTVLLFTQGCERPIEQISDDELQRKFEECSNMNDPAPAMIFACENYQRECERRNKEKGRFIC